MQSRISFLLWTQETTKVEVKDNPKLEKILYLCSLRCASESKQINYLFNVLALGVLVYTFAVPRFYRTF